MKTEAQTGMDTQWVIHAISQRPMLLTKLIALETISCADWQPFTIIKANHLYLCFENADLVYYNSCYEVVLSSLIERMHFHRLAQISKTKPNRT